MVDINFTEEEMRSAFDLYEMSVNIGLKEQESLKLALTSLNLNLGNNDWPKDEKIDFRYFNDWITEIKPKGQDLDNHLFSLLQQGDAIDLQELRKHNDELGLNIQSMNLDDMLLEGGIDDNGVITLKTFSEMLKKIRDREEQGKEVKQESVPPVTA